MCLAETACKNAHMNLPCFWHMLLNQINCHVFWHMLLNQIAMFCGTCYLMQQWHGCYMLPLLLEAELPRHLFFQGSLCTGWVFSVQSPLSTPHRSTCPSPTAWWTGPCPSSSWQAWSSSSVPWCPAACISVIEQHCCLCKKSANTKLANRFVWSPPVWPSTAPLGGVPQLIVVHSPATSNNITLPWLIVSVKVSPWLGMKENALGTKMPAMGTIFGQLPAHTINANIFLSSANLWAKLVWALTTKPKCPRQMNAIQIPLRPAMNAKKWHCCPVCHGTP